MCLCSLSLTFVVRSGCVLWALMALKHLRQTQSLNTRPLRSLTLPKTHARALILSDRNSMSNITRDGQTPDCFQARIQSDGQTVPGLAREEKERKNKKTEQKYLQTEMNLNVNLCLVCFH